MLDDLSRHVSITLLIFSIKKVGMSISYIWLLQRHQISCSFKRNFSIK